jgi:hypothetical protein
MFKSLIDLKMIVSIVQRGEGASGLWSEFINNIIVI